jgi:Cd2+/Zn2+-exporting ATPase
MSEQESGCCGCSSKSAGNDKISFTQEASVLNDNAEKTLTLRIDQMDCPTEEALIRSKLDKMPGVSSLVFNLVNRRLTIKHTRRHVCNS